MTKDQELAIIDQTIAQLGARSYLGPWLASIRPELEASIRSDFNPAPYLPAEAERRGRVILADAETRAEQIITTARQTIAAEHTVAQNQIAGARARARRQLELIAGEL